MGSVNLFKALQQSQATMNSMIMIHPPAIPKSMVPRLKDKKSDAHFSQRDQPDAIQ